MGVNTQKFLKWEQHPTSGCQKKSWLRWKLQFHTLCLTLCRNLEKSCYNQNHVLQRAKITPKRNTCLLYPLPVSKVRSRRLLQKKCDLRSRSGILSFFGPDDPENIYMLNDIYWINLSIGSICSCTFVFSLYLITAKPEWRFIIIFVESTVTKYFFFKQTTSLTKTYISAICHSQA